MLGRDFDMTLIPALSIVSKLIFQRLGPQRRSLTLNLCVFATFPSASAPHIPQLPELTGPTVLSLNPGWRHRGGPALHLRCGGSWREGAQGQVSADLGNLKEKHPEAKGTIVFPVE